MSIGGIDRNKKRKWRTAYETWNGESGYLNEDDHFIGTFEEANTEPERRAKAFEEKHDALICKGELMVRRKDGVQ